MHNIIQFQLREAVISVNIDKIVHSQYDLTVQILEIVFDDGENMSLKISYEQFQQYDLAFDKLVIIEDKDDFH